MTGLTMCSTMTCPLRTHCLRFMAAPSCSQTWAECKPKGKKCRGFVNMRKDGAHLYAKSALGFAEPTLKR